MEQDINTVENPTTHDLLAKLVAIETKIDAVASLLEKCSQTGVQNAGVPRQAAAAADTYTILADGRRWKGAKQGAFYFARRESDGLTGSLGIADPIVHGRALLKGDRVRATGEAKLEQDNNGKPRFTLFARAATHIASADGQSANNTATDEDVPF